MYKLFEIAKQVADSDSRTYTSIMQLTKDIALSGGYRREYVELKNKKKVLRTQYGYKDPADPTNKKVVINWDLGLVAKWLMYYKSAIITSLLKHPEMKEYQTFIISRTFSILFNALNLEKLQSDAGINNVFNLCLSNRIGETLYFMPSDSRLAEYERNKKQRTLNKATGKIERVPKNRVNLQEMFENACTSLDFYMEDLGYTPAAHFNDLDPLLVDLRIKLKDNELGLKLLEAMLYSNEEVKPHLIRNYIKISPDLTLVEKVKYINQLDSAWKIILNTLKDHLDEDIAAQYNWNKPVKFKLDKDSAEVKVQRTLIKQSIHNTDNLSISC